MKNNNVYLENIGFRQCTEKDIEKILERFPSANCPTDCFDYLTWHIYEGDLELDELNLDNAYLFITGNLTINKTVINVDENYGGLIVWGKTKVNCMRLSGYGCFLGGIEFNVLYSCGSDEWTFISNPKGKLLYSYGADLIIENFYEEQVEYLFSSDLDYVSFGDVTKLLSKKYFWWHEEDEFITFEKFKTAFKEKIKNDDDPEYYESWTEENYYLEYLEETEIDIEMDKVINDIQAGKKVFID